MQAKKAGGLVEGLRLLANPEPPSRQGESQPCFGAFGGTDRARPDARTELEAMVYV